MQSPCIKEVSEVCFSGCCTNPFHNLPETHYVTSKQTNNKISPKNEFIAATRSSIQPNAQFTNHESLPSLAQSFMNLNKAYPEYSKTNLADKIRTEEYHHLSLSDHVCLDYIGHGLLSYSQQHGDPSCRAAIASTSSSPPPPPPYHSRASDVPLFNISYKSVNLTSQLLYVDQESEFESLMRKRIMKFMNISEDDYSMVFTANQASAFKLLADSYPFHCNHNLLTVYDFENEAVEAMIECSKKKGAQIMSAEFSWPTLRIHTGKLRKKIVSKSKKRNRGLFVFPLQSRMTGTRYSYLWMTIAQENGWQVLLDASALGAKGMETLGLSLFEPDFLVCSFFKVFGENPSGFSCLFVKKSSVSMLNKHSTTMGIVSLVPLLKPFERLSSTDDDSSQTMPSMELKKDHSTDPGPSSAAISLQQRSDNTSELEEITEVEKEDNETEQSNTTPDTFELMHTEASASASASASGSRDIECRGLDHADKLGLILISSRARYLINWLINALMCLRHPHSGNGHPFVLIYGQKIKFNRAPSLAFNVYDWKGERVDPKLVQKLADRNNISLNCGFLQHIWFADAYEEEKKMVLEFKTKNGDTTKPSKYDGGISVITVSIGLLTNFEDMYKLWAFVSRFLDADYVEKERWRYMALNQSTVEV